MSYKTEISSLNATEVPNTAEADTISMRDFFVVTRNPEAYKIARHLEGLGVAAERLRKKHKGEHIPLEEDEYYSDRLGDSSLQQALKAEQIERRRWLLLYNSAELLAKVHLANVVYGSAYFENVIVDKEQNLFLTDFSNSRLIDTKEFDWANATADTVFTTFLVDLAPLRNNLATLGCNENEIRAATESIVGKYRLTEKEKEALIKRLLGEAYRPRDPSYWLDYWLGKPQGNIVVASDKEITNGNESGGRIFPTTDLELTRTEVERLEEKHRQKTADLMRKLYTAGYTRNKDDAELAYQLVIDPNVVEAFKAISRETLTLPENQRVEQLIFLFTDSAGIQYRRPTASTASYPALSIPVRLAVIANPRDLTWVRQQTNDTVKFDPTKAITYAETCQLVKYRRPIKDWAILIGIVHTHLKPEYDLRATYRLLQLSPTDLHQLFTYPGKIPSVIPKSWYLEGILSPELEIVAFYRKAQGVTIAGITTDITADFVGVLDFS